MPLFRDMKLGLQLQLQLLIAVPAVIVVLLAGLIQLQLSSNAFEEDLKISYASYVEEKSTSIERWLADSRGDVLALAENFGIKTALKDFSLAWNAHGGTASSDLRRFYISENTHPIGKKDELVKAPEGSDWTSAHERHHVSLRSYQRARGFYDLFLFDIAGNLVYSVFKEDDFALNFEQGKYADSNLGEVFRLSLGLPAGQMHMTSIEPYRPSGDAPAMFMATPVFDEGQKIGVVAVQLPLDLMAETLADTEFLGETGEAYIVDNKGRALTNSRHQGGFATLDPLPSVAQIQLALEGRSAFFDASLGVNGQTVVAKTEGITTPRGDIWGLVFEIDRAEAMSFVNQSTVTTALELLTVGLLLCFLSWAVVRGMIKRIERLANEMDEIANQNFAQAIAGQDKMDEIGFISRTLASFQQSLADAAEARAREQTVQANNARVVKLLSASLNELAQGDFHNQIVDHFPEEHETLRHSLNAAMNGLSEVVYSVRHTADGIHQKAQAISRSADELSTRTESQASAMEQTATAIEQMTESIRSSNTYTENVEKAVSAARENVTESGTVVKETIQAMTEIEHSSQQISQIIGVIDEIAFQTDLLAVNAGLEAARAGKAGRGFAVVASEVRNLAQLSSESAMEIKSLIETSGEQVGRGVQMVGRTGNALTLIAARVQEISDLVQQIAQSSREQSMAIIEINYGMNQLDQVTTGNAAMVEENTAASHMLRSDADLLVQHVGRFKITDDEDTADL